MDATPEAPKPATTLCSRLLPPSAPTDVKVTPATRSVQLCWGPPANYGCADEVRRRLSGWRRCGQGGRDICIWRVRCLPTFPCRLWTHPSHLTPHNPPQYRVRATQLSQSRSFGAVPLLWSYNQGGCVQIGGLLPDTRYSFEVQAWSNLFQSGGAASIKTKTNPEGYTA